MNEKIIRFISICLVIVFFPVLSKAQCRASIFFHQGDTLCQGSTFNFKDSSFNYQLAQDSIVKEVFNYGDGNKDSLIITSYTRQYYTGSITHGHTYTNKGTYTLSLTIYTQSGCSNTVSGIIHVYSNPVASFTPGNDSIGCTPFVINFSNTNPASDSIVAYSWTFTDGGVSTSPTVTHTYTYYGGTAYLSVQSIHGCYGSTAGSYKILPTPIALFNYTVDSVGSKSFHFKDSSSTSPGTAQWQWLFGDGSVAVSQNAAHTYQNYGTDSVSLMVTSTNGCSNTITKVITVDSISTGCKAAFVVGSNNCQSLSTLFTDASKVALADSISKEIWNYGDGESDTLNLDTLAKKNISQRHFYNNAGIYPVTLTIFSKTGCTSTYTHNATILTNPVVADSFSYMQAPCGGDSAYNVQFFLNNRSVVGTINDTWNFGDGSPVLFSEPDSIIHAYSSPGNYQVKLISRVQQCDLRDTVIKTINVYGTPVANFNYIQDTAVAKKMFFTDISNSYHGSITSFYWDFGDGTVSSLQNPSHTYSTGGSYTIKHFITANAGCKSDTTTHLIYVDSVTTHITNLYQSNFGNDFWAGFGYEERMKTTASSGYSVNTEFYIIGGSQPSVVTVSLPGIPAASSFPTTVTVPANGEVTVSGFPQGDPNDAKNTVGLPDTRLYYTGISNRAIHITSSQPIAVWQRIYASNNSAGATLLLPSDIWNNEYTVQTMGGKTNTGIPNSFFYVIPQQDNTQINFTPSSDIIDSLSTTIFALSNLPSDVKYHAGTPYTITLNKGQIFNAMGFVQSDGTGVDLSTTTITSQDPTKKIAVFAGNGRVVISSANCNNTTGSDNLIQQMFPQIAWGTKYLTTPTKTMEYNLYRITVKDPATVVSVNGTVLPTSSLIKNSYYQIEGNSPNCITSNKSIMVTQYITSAVCPAAAQGNNGSGDPEMIILSPITQVSNKLSIYSANMVITTGASYINVVIKKTGINSFKLDGLNTADTGTSSFTGVAYASGGTIPISNAFRVHPGDTSYAFARFKVTFPALHLLSSDSTFSAIAYGLSQGESYGYNAGFTLNYPHIVYTFTGNGNWDDPSSWSNNSLPPADVLLGSEIVISGNCTLNVPQTLESGATLTILKGGSLTVLNDLLIQK